MNDRAFQFLFIALLSFTLLLVLPHPGAAGGSAAARAGDGSAAAPVRSLQARPVCPACDRIQELCAAGCSGVKDRAGFVKCMMGCDNAVGSCRCDEPVTLRSEDILPELAVVGAKAASCHGTVSCQPDYPSCASWGGPIDCGNPACASYQWCPDDCDQEFGCGGPALRQRTEIYRVCFNQFGQSCTEYKPAFWLVLGCGC